MEVPSNTAASKSMPKRPREPPPRPSVVPSWKAPFWPNCHRLIGGSGSVNFRTDVSAVACPDGWQMPPRTAPSSHHAANRAPRRSLRIRPAPPGSFRICVGWRQINRNPTTSLEKNPGHDTRTATSAFRYDPSSVAGQVCESRGIPATVRMPRPPECSRWSEPQSRETWTATGHR